MYTWLLSFLIIDRRFKCTPMWCNLEYCMLHIALSTGHSQILSRSHGQKLGEGLVPILCHGPEMVDSMSMLLIAL